MSDKKLRLHAPSGWWNKIRLHVAYMCLFLTPLPQNGSKVAGANKCCKASKVRCHHRVLRVTVLLQWTMAQLHGRS